MFIPLSTIPLYRLTDRLSISYCEKAKDVQSFAFYTSALSCCTSAGMVGIIGWSSIRWRAYRLRVRPAVAAFARIAASSLSVTRMMIFLVLFSLMMVVVLLSHGCLLASVASFLRGTGFGVAGATRAIGR